MNELISVKDMSERQASLNLPVAVYGTLRTGRGNRPVLGNDAVSQGISKLEGFKMFTTGNNVSCIPFVIYTGKEEDTVTVELFTVPRGSWPKTLEALDWLESSPEWYTRTKVDTGANGDVWMYLFEEGVAEHYLRNNVAEVPTGDWFAPFEEAV